MSGFKKYPDIAEVFDLEAVIKGDLDDNNILMNSSINASGAGI